LKSLEKGIGNSTILWANAFILKWINCYIVLQRIFALRIALGIIRFRDE
jgi:hypothetical protein